MNMCIKERLSKRELERQIDSGYYERYMLSQKPAIEESRRATGNVFLDNYVFDFLDVRETVSEHDLQKSIIRKLKNFILKIGKDFTFIGEEYRVQVGKHDYYIDLLFYHRGLSCLVAFEMKIGEFAHSRSLSPTMMSEYNLKLIDKKLLQRKLKEYIELAGTDSADEKNENVEK